MSGVIATACALASSETVRRYAKGACSAAVVRSSSSSTRILKGLNTPALDRPCDAREPPGLRSAPGCSCGYDLRPSIALDAHPARLAHRRTSGARSSRAACRAGRAWTCTATARRSVRAPRRVLGTPCNQSAWKRPPNTIRSPPAGERSRGRGVARVAPLHEERPLRTRRQDRDDRVVEPAHLAVAVHGDALARVAVVREPESVERCAVLRGDRLLRFGQHRMAGIRDGAARAQTRLVDPALVAPHASLAPRDIGREVREHVVGAAQPAARDVDPGRVVELQPLERHTGIDRGGIDRGASVAATSTSSRCPRSRLRIHRLRA